MIYQELASKLQTLIDNRVYPVGSALPGVRRLSTQHQVSVSTAVRAVRELELRGVLEARDRSGFYVKQPLAQRDPPLARAMGRNPRLVTGQERVLRLVQSVSDRSIVNFGAAVPDTDYLPGIAIEKAFHKVLRESRHRCLGYEFPPGAPELRLEIAKRLAGLQCQIGPDDVLITNGCQDSLGIALKLLTNPGDTVAIESPTYYGLLQIIESLQLKVVEIPTDSVDGISIGALGKALDKWKVAACVVVSNFSNPLGACLSDKRKQALLELLNRHKVPLIEDDIYGDLPFTGDRPKPILSWDTKGQVYYCGASSKVLSAGLRVGWLVANDQHKRAEFLQYTQTVAVATPSQLALAEFLSSTHYDRFLSSVRPKYASSVARMTERVYQLFPDDIRVSRPAGGFVLWVELPGNVNTTELLEEALEKGVSFAPGALFSNTGKFQNCLRLNCAVRWDARTERALAALAKLL